MINFVNPQTLVVDLQSFELAVLVYYEAVLALIGILYKRDFFRYRYVGVGIGKCNGTEKKPVFTK